MPVRSKAQLRLMYAAAAGTLRKKNGPSPAVAREFLAATPKGKKLPERVKKRRGK